MAEERDGISDDLLDNQNNKIDVLLKSRAISKVDRVVLETQQYFLMFLRSDHKKIVEMYPYYVEEKKKRERSILLNNAIIIFLVTDILSRVLSYVTR
jgi:hypothetical protein